MNRKKIIEKLSEYYQRSGYARSLPNPKKRRASHRGYEVRFGARNQQERDEIVSLLDKLGFKPGNPFSTGWNWRIPIYGREQVYRLCYLLRVQPWPKPRINKANV